MDFFLTTVVRDLFTDRVMLTFVVAAKKVKIFYVAFKVEKIKQRTQMYYLQENPLDPHRQAVGGRKKRFLLHFAKKCIKWSQI